MSWKAGSVSRILSLSIWSILVPSRILKASPGNIREQQHYRKPRRGSVSCCHGSWPLSHLTTARRPAVNLHRVGCFGLNLDILDFPPPDFQQNDKIQLTLLTATHSSTACLPAKDSVETGKIGAFWKRHHILNSFLLKLYSMFGIPSAREWLFCFQVSPLFSVSLYRLGPFQVDVTVRAVLWQILT